MMDPSTEIYTTKGSWIAKTSFFIPAVGSIINVRKKDYYVVRVDFSIDDADTMQQRVRCNVYVRPEDEG